jgi:hypothetical protein
VNPGPVVPIDEPRDPNRIICSNGERRRSFYSQSEGFWIPTPKQIQDAENKFHIFLKNKPPAESPDLWNKFASYKRQYVGLTMNGQQIIVGDFYCTSLGRTTDCEPMNIEDGGDCFFHVEHDVNGNVNSVQINGYA